MRVARAVGDVSELPESAFGSAAITWWGMVGLMLIEGITLVLVASAYLYIRKNFYEWPPRPTLDPALGAALANVAVLAVSVVPAYMATRFARRHEPRGVLLSLVGQAALGIAFLVLRWFEIQALHVRWDTNAYGSVSWGVLVAHTLVGITDVMDTIGLMMLFLLKEPEERHFVDTCENSQFWYFIVASWIPLFALVFLYPRWT